MFLTDITVGGRVMSECIFLSWRSQTVNVSLTVCEATQSIATSFYLFHTVSEMKLLLNKNFVASAHQSQHGYVTAKIHNIDKAILPATLWKFGKINTKKTVYTHSTYIFGIWYFSYESLYFK